MVALNKITEKVVVLLLVGLLFVIIYIHIDFRIMTSDLSSKALKWYVYDIIFVKCLLNDTVNNNSVKQYVKCLNSQILQNENGYQWPWD